MAQTYIYTYTFTQIYIYIFKNNSLFFSILIATNWHGWRFKGNPNGFSLLNRIECFTKVGVNNTFLEIDSESMNNIHMTSTPIS